MLVVEASEKILAVGSTIGTLSIVMLILFTRLPAPVNISAAVGLAPALGNWPSAKSGTAKLLTELKVEITSLKAALYSAAVGLACSK